MIAIFIMLVVGACAPSDEAIRKAIEETKVAGATNTVKPTIEKLSQPEPTEEVSKPKSTQWIVVVHCPECEGIALIMWSKPGVMSPGGGKVNHGDTCIVLATGSAQGVQKYKLNCSGKIGWLRASGLVTK